MAGIQNKIAISSGVIGIISLFTPLIFHISPNYIYHFWFWGFTLFFGLTSNEIGFTFDSELEFLIPGIISSIFILISSVLILFTSMKVKREQEFKGKYYYIGGICMIITPLSLILGWQIFYIIIRGYPTFWGTNYYWPNFAIILQFIAGSLALLSNYYRLRRNS